MQEIRLDNEYAKLINMEYDHSTDSMLEKNRDKIIPENKFFELLTNNVNRSDQILPLNCRYIENLPAGTRIVVTEDPPKIRTCTFNIDFDRMVESIRIEGNLNRFGLENFLEENKRPYMLRLSLPFIVYIFVVDSRNYLTSMFLAFRLSPISSMYDYLLIPSLLNISESLNVCLGEGHPLRVPTLSELIDSVINKFWSNPFNFDYTTFHNLYKNTDGISNFLSWAYYTSIDPMFIFKIKWKPWGKNLKNTINHISTQYTERKLFQYNDFVSIFNRPRQEETKKGVIFENVGDSVYCNHTLAEVGDQVPFKNREDVYIDSFSSCGSRYGQNANESKITHINLEMGNKTIKYKLSNEFKHFLEKQLQHSSELNSIDISGTKVKKGDILYLSDIEMYAEIEKIRKSIDNMKEIKLNGRYYLSDTIKANIIDKNNILINGTKVEQNEDYTLYRFYQKPFSKLLSKDFKFKKMKISDRKLVVSFRSDDESIRISYGDIRIGNHTENLAFIKTNDLEPLPPIIRYGMMFIRGEFYKGESHIICKDTDEDGYGNCYANIEDLYKHGNITEDSFSIESYDFNIKFKVGDKVCVPNWDNPIEMLTIKTITKIYCNETSLIFDLETSNGVSSCIEYYSTINKTAKIGSIRKIQTSYKGVHTGNKIKCKEVGVIMFPKKDTNIIIGFITDTGGEPLVLCSNGCTIWFSDLIDKFEIITSKNPKYKKLNHAPISLNKVKFQIGDLLLESNDRGRVMIIAHNNSRTYAYSIRSIFDFTFDNNWLSYDNYINTRNNYHRFYGILNPRQSVKSLSNTDNFLIGTPNLHNLIIPNNFSKLSFSDKVCLQEEH